MDKPWKVGEDLLSEELFQELMARWQKRGALKAGWEWAQLQKKRMS